MSIVKAGLLAALVQDKKPKTASELSILTGVEELLIGKFHSFGRS